MKRAAAAAGPKSVLMVARPLSLELTDKIFS
jgi:hypothetical protein